MHNFNLDQRYARKNSFPPPNHKLLKRESMSNSLLYEIYQ